MNVKRSNQILVICLSLGVISCTPNGQGILHSNSTIADTIDAATASAPFAFDIAADTISYNGCVQLSQSTTIPTNIPGLTIGASEGFVTNNANGAVKAGLKLKTDFLSYIGRNFSPQSPALTIPPSQVQRILNNSTKNANAFLQYSIRRKKDLRPNINLIVGNNGQAVTTKDRDVVVFEQSLTTGFVANLLTKDITYTPTGGVLSEGPRTFNLSNTPDPVPIIARFQLNQTLDESFPAPLDDGSSGTTNPELIFGAAEQYPDRIRKLFNSNGDDKIILTAGFGGIADAAPAGTTTDEETIENIRRKNMTEVSKAYGRGYSLRFTPKTTGVSGWLINVMSGTAVTEIDLATGSNVQGVTWTCENFIIALPAHFDNKKLKEPTCSPIMASDLTAVPSRVDKIKNIRRQHSADEWNIGLFIPKDTDLGVTVADRVAKRSTFEICVSPKLGSCYLPTQGIFDILDDPTNISKDAGVQYDTTKECYLTAYKPLGITYSVTSDNDKRSLGRCAQYLSVCVRNSQNF